MKQTLLESVVLNPEAVDGFAKAYQRRINPEAGKDWMYRRLRQIILNADDKILTPLGGHEIPPNAPQWVMAAIDRREPIYKFDMQHMRPGMDQLVNEIDILIDFINGAYATARAHVDKANQVAVEDQRLAAKTLEKLLRMTWPQALEAADQWAQRAAKKTNKLSKDGGEVIMEWPDGYYAIRFTDRNTMMRDGGQLQNCLASGTYWDQVSRGEQMVIAIRKPNDDAVVGMRFSANGRTIHECKGKNNKYITQQYVQYVVDLLASLGTANKNHDLEGAGISFNATTQRYGTFKDVATLIHDAGGIKIYETHTNGVVEYKKRDVLDYTHKPSASGKSFLTSVTGSSLIDGNTELVVKLLKLIGRPATQEVQNALAAYHVYSKDGEWGTIASVGVRLGLFSVGATTKCTAYEIGTREAGQIVLAMDDDRTSGMAIRGGVVVSGDNFVQRLSGRILGSILTAAGIRGARDFENTYLHSDGWVYVKNKGYVDVTETNPLAVFSETRSKNTDDNLPLYKVPGSDVFLQKTVTGKFATIQVTGAGKVTPIVPQNVDYGPHTHSISMAVRWIFQNGKGKSIEDPEQYAISEAVTIPGVGELWQEHDPGKVAEMLSKLPDKDRCFMPVRLIPETQTYLNKLFSLGLFTPPVQRKWLKALKPKKAFEIRQETDRSFGNIKLTEYHIEIPDMLMHLLAQDMLTDPGVRAEAEKIRAAIEQKVDAFFDKNEGRATYTEVSNWPFRDLSDALHAMNAKAARIVDAEKTRLLSNTGNVEDKFAALNIDRKLKNSPRRY